MTRREYFEALISTSKNGGFPSKEKNSTQCLYLSETGEKCAVGLIIPDGHPGQNEMIASADLFRKFPDLLGHIPDGMDESDMYSAQRCHDRTSRLPWSHTSFLESLHDYFPNDVSGDGVLRS